MSKKLITHKGGFKREGKEGKIDYTLIPLDVLKDLAIHYTSGAIVHGEDNWKKAKDIKTFKKSAARHFVAILNGDEDEDHYSALVWNINCLKWFKLNAKKEKGTRVRGKRTK